MPTVPHFSRRHFCRLTATLFGLRVLPACTLFPLGGLLSGCSAFSPEKNLENGSLRFADPVDDGGPALVFLPALSAAPELMLDARLRVRFLPKASRSGAPISPPTLRAMIMTSPKGVNVAFTVMGLTAWTIAWTTDGIQEKRHPKLNDEVLADRMLRDLALIHWPIAALRAALPVNTTLLENASGRSILRNGVTILRVTRQTAGQLRHTILTNAIEGYILTIEEVL